MIKKLLKSIREYKLISILTPILVSGEVVLEVLLTYYTKELIDKGIDANNLDMILKIGGTLVIMAIGSLIFGYLAARFCAKASSGFAKNLRSDIFNKIQEFSFSNIDKFKSSGLITRLTTDVDHIKMAYQTLIRTFVRAPLTIIFALIMIIKVNPKTALVFLAVIPVFFIAILYIIGKVNPLFRAGFDEYDHLNNVVSENLNGIKVVKSYVQEKKEISKFSNVSHKMCKIFLKALNYLALNMPIMQLSMYLIMILISWIGARLIVSGNMTTGELMILFTYIMQVLSSLMMVGMIIVTIIISKESCERVFEVLNEKIDLENTSDPVTKIKDGSIKFENVSFSYVQNEKKLCLQDINFEINSGETIGIIGSTGSGKSTLINLIPRLYDATIGRVLVSNIDVRDIDLKTLRDNVGVVLQKNVLFKGTIEENLRWGNENATLDEIIASCKIAECYDFIMQKEEGFNYMLDEGGTNLSGGQKQRVCIARALLKKPKILILDDSTSAVDTKTDAKIQSGFKSYISSTTKIIIAQRISSIENCDKIIVLDDGKISDIGTHENLLKTNKIYKEVYASQQGGYDE